MGKDLEWTKNFEKKNKVGGLTLSDFKTDCTVIKMVRHGS